MDGQLKIIKAKHISVLQRSIVLQCCDWLRGEDAQTRVQKRYCIFSGAKISRERERWAVGSGGASQCAREQLEIQVSICKRQSNPEARCSD